MFAMTKTYSQERESVVLNFLKGLIVSMVLSFALILIFALFIKWFSFSDAFIVPVVMIIKGASVVCGSIFAVKGEKGLIKGAMFGLVYILFAFFIFSSLTGSFCFEVNNFLDVVCSVVLGAITGIFKVNAK